MKVTHDTSSNWRTRYSHQLIGAGTGGLGNMRTNKDHPNYSIIMIGQNTEESPGYLRRLAVIQESSGKSSTNAGMKKSQKSKIIFSLRIVKEAEI